MGLERAQLLFNQSRFNDAEKHVREFLSTSPNDAEAHALLALCYSEQKKINEAKASVQTALSLFPNHPYFFYVFSKIFIEERKYAFAEEKINEAIKLDPNQAEYFGVLALVKLNQKEWKLALDASNQGLSRDPENISCLNIRATALLKLDKKEESFQTIETALEQDPENAFTHASTGWAYLEKGEHKKALIHFRESLRLNPNFEYAKSGLVEALKAKYFFYRMLLKYFFWIGNLKKGQQWAFFIGAYVLYLIVKNMAREFPVLYVLVALYLVFAFSTWIASPLLNLMLRLNPYGRYALTKNEIISANLVGISWAIAILSACTFFIFNNTAFLYCAGFGMTMSLPFGSMLIPEKKTGKKILVIYSVLLLLIGIVALIGEFLNLGYQNVSFVFYIFGIFIYQWVANGIIGDEN